MKLTPPHLQPVLSRVKRFIEKMPEGATLTVLAHKVTAYRQLSRRDKGVLIDILRDSGMLCVIDDGRTTSLHHPKFGHQTTIAAVPVQENVMESAVLTKQPVTPETLRKQAEALIRAAEEAEKKAGDRAEIKKQFDPLKLEILQAYGLSSRKFDEFIDAMADLGKSVQKLKDLSL